MKNFYMSKTQTKQIEKAKDKLEKYIFRINMATEADIINIQRAFIKYRAPKRKMGDANRQIDQKNETVSKSRKFSPSICKARLNKTI